MLYSQIGDTQTVQDLLALQTRISDGVPFSGEAYRTYIKDCYQENYLIQGKLVVGGQRVDLARIACSVLTITAAKDWICPPESAAVLDDLVASVDRCVLDLYQCRSQRGCAINRHHYWIVGRGQRHATVECPIAQPGCALVAARAADIEPRQDPEGDAARSRASRYSASSGSIAGRSPSSIARG